MSSPASASHSSSQPGSHDPKTPVRQFDIPTDHSGSTTRITISEPNLRADNLSLETWASSYILAGLLRDFRITFPRSGEQQSNDGVEILPILEIGAGTGLVGISAQKIWKQPVVLTDLGPIVPGLRLNIDMNAHIYDQPDSNYGDDFSGRCGTLDWMKPSILTMYPDGEIYTSSTTKAQVILAADTVYSDEHPEMLTNVVKNWLAPNPDSRIIIAYPLRVAYLDEIRDLWSRFEEAGLEAVEEGKKEASEEMFDDELLVEWSIWRWKEIRS
ncbi:hypothetical protein ABW19_dt0206662 [Dactylella cylindrospora]|nr:hypothetical protein ABW19_dt0206662 [Dactylella cylindrospora]